MSVKLKFFGNSFSISIKNSDGFNPNASEIFQMLNNFGSF